MADLDDFLADLDAVPFEEGGEEEVKTAAGRASAETTTSGARVTGVASVATDTAATSTTAAPAAAVAGSGSTELTVGVAAVVEADDPDDVFGVSHAASACLPNGSAAPPPAKRAALGFGAVPRALVTKTIAKPAVLNKPLLPTPAPPPASAPPTSAAGGNLAGSIRSATGAVLPPRAGATSVASSSAVVSAAVSAGIHAGKALIAEPYPGAFAEGTVLVAPTPTPTPTPASVAAGGSFGAGGSAAAPSGSAAASGSSSGGGEKTASAPASHVRTCGGEMWVDNTLSEWPEGDIRLFVGNLGNEVSDDGLYAAFRKYRSLAKVKVVRDPTSRKTKGFGFVSIMDPADALAALKEMNGAYVGNRPVNVRRSTWQEKEIKVVRKKEKERAMRALVGL